MESKKTSKQNYGMPATRLENQRQYHVKSKITLGNSSVTFMIPYDSECWRVHWEIFPTDALCQTLWPNIISNEEQQHKFAFARRQKKHRLLRWFGYTL